jgi:hypothetical protein
MCNSVMGKVIINLGYSSDSQSIMVAESVAKKLDLKITPCSETPVNINNDKNLKKKGRV